MLARGRIASNLGGVHHHTNPPAPALLLLRFVRLIAMGDGRKIGFIGAGQMAEALARGFVAKDQVKVEDVIATDPSEARVKVFSEWGAKTVEGNVQVRRRFAIRIGQAD